MTEKSASNPFELMMSQAQEMARAFNPAMSALGAFSLMAVIICSPAGSKQSEPTKSCK